METLIKQTRELGTSAGVLLPRSWLNKQVAVTLLQPSLERISKDIINMIIDKNLNEEIKGIYLFGSYARGDYEPGSDIDILIITNTLNKLIKENNYEVILVSEDNFSKNLPNSLIYFSTLSESKVIFNKNLIEKYKIKKIKFNKKSLLNEIKRILKINKDSIEFFNEYNKNIPDGVVYSIVLRLRELYLMKCLFLNKRYFKKDFLKIIGNKVNSAYLRIKREEKEIDDIQPNELKNLLELSEKWLKELKD
ncbi:nucleotidyltransferase domain-containing protein [Candidatus Pacearchaeota archaeon]|nr:nucleotidyltransferase domain-containing protein [Candidatus Pacearchaeota archaeon]